MTFNDMLGSGPWNPILLGNELACRVPDINFIDAVIGGGITIEDGELQPVKTKNMHNLQKEAVYHNGT